MDKTVSFWLLGISIILLGASIFLNISNTVITDESIVLAFIGILATFIVVGNYSQVTEIRNSTNKQIEKLDFKTQKKIDELNILHDKIKEASEKLNKVEKNIYFTAAEAYRLYGVYTKDKKSYKDSTSHYLNAVNMYLKSGSGTDMLVRLFDDILDNLKPEKWHSAKGDFTYQKRIKTAKEFPDSYEQKQKIIDLLEKYKIEELQKL